MPEGKAYVNINTLSRINILFLRFRWSWTEICIRFLRVFGK